jgi:hypothetical protein
MCRRKMVGHCVSGVLCKLVIVSTCHRGVYGFARSNPVRAKGLKMKNGWQLPTSKEALVNFPNNFWRFLFTRSMICVSCDTSTKIRVDPNCVGRCLATLCATQELCFVQTVLEDNGAQNRPDHFLPLSHRNQTPRSRIVPVFGRKKSFFLWQLWGS